MEPNRDDGARYMENARRQRHALLTALYQKRLTNPGQPSLTLTDMEQLLGVSKAEIEFSLWYLTEGQFVKRTDNGNHSILIRGVDLAEQELDRKHSA